MRFVYHRLTPLLSGSLGHCPMHPCASQSIKHNFRLFIRFLGVPRAAYANLLGVAAQPFYSIFGGPATVFHCALTRSPRQFCHCVDGPKISTRVLDIPKCSMILQFLVFPLAVLYISLTRPISRHRLQMHRGSGEMYLDPPLPYVPVDFTERLPTLGTGRLWPKSKNRPTDLGL
ncbi:hypothetical protein B0H15DRAFT_568065 [Mycena belliarum]|uniref:Uncharacterized protein n=1 Tax=Mycena belliarum TaxID=1033014 RepID=A0AAD6XIL0_9AGAR|nr:hypothetical protein B0H15DRAFT_568065 [Mycena belliae]